MVLGWRRRLVFVGLGICAFPATVAATSHGPEQKSATLFPGWKISYFSQTPGRPGIGLYVSQADGSHRRLYRQIPHDAQSPSWSPDGRRVAFRWNPQSEGFTPLIVLERGGTRWINLTSRNGLAGFPASWSPDGMHLVAAVARRVGTHLALYTMTPEGADPKRITSTVAEAGYPSWSPTGKLIAFHRVERGGWNIYTVRPDGTHLRRLTTDYASEAPVWSPNGEQIAYDKAGATWLMNTDGSNQHLLTARGGAPHAWAPGPAIAFDCSAQGRPTLCAINADGSNLRVLLGGKDSGFPAWLPKGTPRS